MAGEYSALLRRLSGSDAVQTWWVTSSDGKDAEMHAVLNVKALARLLDSVGQLERRPAAEVRRRRGRAGRAE